MAQAVAMTRGSMAAGLALNPWRASPAMNRTKKKPPFDPQGFLSQVTGEQWTLTDYRKNLTSRSGGRRPRRPTPASDVSCALDWRRAWR
jgi:hypothetical protein